jgi:hypothetical protein
MLEQVVYIVTTALLSFEWSKLTPAIITAANTRIFKPTLYEEYLSFISVNKFY